MNDGKLHDSLMSAMESCYDEIKEKLNGATSPTQGVELTFDEALREAFSTLPNREVIPEQSNRSLSKWGAANIKMDTNDGFFDILLRDSSEDETHHYAFELKVISFPNSKGDGYNVMQIGQDILRLMIMNHKGDQSGKTIGGAWNIILGFGEDIKTAKDDEDLIRVMHNALHNELKEFLKKTNDLVRNFKDARSLGGTQYMGLSKTYDEVSKLISDDEYFAVKLPGKEFGVLALWIGHSE